MDRVVQNSTLQYQEVHKVHIGEEVKRYKMAPGGTEVPVVRKYRRAAKR